MSYSSRQVYQSRSSRREQRRVSNNSHEIANIPSSQFHQLAYRSYKYPQQIGFQDLVSRKNVLTELLHQFQSGGGDGITFDRSQSSDYQKRLLLLENQIDSLLKYQMVIGQGGENGRGIDYTNFLNEKENQINELQKKITYYETTFRKHQNRVRQLQNQVAKLHSMIIQKNRMIDHLEGKNVREWHTLKDSSMNYLEALIGDLEKLKRNGGNLSFGLLEGTIEAWIRRLPEESNLRCKVKESQERGVNVTKYRDFVLGKISQISNLYKTQIQDLSTRLGSSARIEYDPRIMDALSLSDIKSNKTLDSIFGGIFELSIATDQQKWGFSRVVEVPVQDARTKALIHKLAKQMHKIYKKYPKLRQEIDPRLAQFFSEQIIDMIEVDQVDRLVQIVKIQPQIVKVDNVYTYSSEKSRKVEFHLRVLIKALLEQMEKMKAKTGISPEIDQGVIGMIRNQIMDIVDVDDILKVYRTVPKIVQVQKVIEKVVDRIVQVPKFVTAQTRSEVPVEVKRYEVVQNTINVPIQQPVINNLVQQKLVQVPQIINTVIPTPQIHQSVVQTVIERPKVVQVDNVVTLDKQIARVVEIEGPERIVEIPRPQVVEIIKEVIVETRQQVEVIKQVQKIVEKIVEVVKEVPKIVQVERVVTKTIPVKEYIENQRVINHVSERFEPVEILVEKVIPIYRVEERIVQVPQIIQKIVPVIEYRTEIKEVKCIEEKPIVQTRLQIQKQIREVPVVQIREVQKIVEKIIEVPVVHEKIIIEKEYIKQPIVETIERVIHKDVQIQKPAIMYEDRIVEVDRVINHCIQVPQIINIERETLVPYEKVVDRVVATPTIVQKIVQKIVEVPKVVEVQKIVEKIIPVPRIVQKVIEVQKIVEKIVKQTVFQERIVEKECRVEVPVFHERLIQVERPVNIYQKVQVPKEVIQQVFVKDVQTRTIPEIHQIEQPPRIVVQVHEVDVPMVVQKICTLRTTDNKYVELKEVQIVPVEIQLPVDIIKEKIVAIENVVPQIQVETAIMQKIVQVEVQPDPQVIQVDRIQEKLKIEKQYQVVEDRIPYYQDRIVEVPVEVQKIIEPVYYEVEKIVKVPHYIDKIVEKIVNIPRIYEVQRRNDVPIKDPIIIPIQKIVPQLITLNQSIQTIVDRIVQVPRLLQKLNVVSQTHDRIVPQTNIQTRIEEVRLIQEREVIVERIKQVQNKIHLVSEVLQRVDKIIEKPTQPVLICQQTIMEVPFIVQKIVEKIVVMPQVVEVLKYVHQIMETDNLVATSEASVEEAEYTRLGRNVNLELTKLRAMLGEVRSDSPEMRKQISIIQGFLAEFSKFIAYPRIREIISQIKVDNVVEKEKLVRIPVNTSDDSQRNLASAVLIDKLLNQLRRFKLANPKMQWQLDEDILRIFGNQLEPVSRYYGNDYNKILDEYVRAINTRFSSLGPWTTDHQQMLRSYIQDRFELAYTSKKSQQQLVRSKAKYDSMKQSLAKVRQQNQMLKGGFGQFQGIFSTIIEQGKKQNRIDQRTENNFNTIFESLSYLIKGFSSQGAHTNKLQPLQGERFTSILRQKEQEIIQLKDRIRQLMMGKSKCNLNHDHRWATGSADHTQCNRKINHLEDRIRELERELERLYIIERDHRGCQAIIDSLKRQINSLRIEISNIKNSKDDRGTKPSISPKDQGQKDSSEGSLYGVNYLQYANLDQNGSNSDTGRIERGVYRSGNYDANQNQKKYGYGAQNYSSQYMSPTGGLSSHGTVQELGTSSKKDGSYRSGYKIEYSREDRELNPNSYQSMDYSRGSNSSQGQSQRVIQMRQARYESSEGGSQVYGSSSKEIIKKTTTRYEEGGNSMSGSTRRFDMSEYDRQFERRRQ